jgi:hypothetical protein
MRQSGKDDNIRNYNLPLVLCGCETRYLELRDEHRLGVFGNRELRKILRNMKDKVTGGWRKPHKEKLHKLHCSPDTVKMIKSKRMRWAGHVALMVRIRYSYKILVAKPEGKREFGRTRRTREDNIKKSIRKIKLGCRALGLFRSRHCAVLPS